MDYQEIRNIVRGEVHLRLGDIQASKRCPECGTYTTMLKVYVELQGEEIPDLAESVVKWRCLNCLKLFTETLIEEA